MRKRIVALGCSMVFLGTPVLACADLTATQTQIQQLSASAVALEAEREALSGRPACAAVISKGQVKINEPFILAWGSVGTLNPGDDPNKSMLVSNGTVMLTIQKVGGWRYTLPFYGKDGGVVMCKVDVFVS